MESKTEKKISIRIEFATFCQKRLKFATFCQTSFIPFIFVLFLLFNEMFFPIIVWVFPTYSHELEHPRDYMCKSDMKFPTPCDCDWDEVCEEVG